MVLVGLLVLALGVSAVMAAITGDWSLVVVGPAVLGVMFAPLWLVGGLHERLSPTAQRAVQVGWFLLVVGALASVSR